jgi:hypothetical protein
MYRRGRTETRSNMLVLSWSHVYVFLFFLFSFGAVVVAGGVSSWNAPSGMRRKTWGGGAAKTPDFGGGDVGMRRNPGVS